MNEQIPMPAAYNESAAIDVHSIFQTIQGEGPYCGQRALFIRLHGCNLRCPGCDTEYTAQRKTYTPHELLSVVIDEHEWHFGALIVITGGEPFRQNVVPALRELLLAGYRVQVETNGVLCPPDFCVIAAYQRLSIVVSPKTSRINATIAERAIAFKYVLRAGEIEDDGLPTRALEHTAKPYVARPPHSMIPVYIQPMDEQDNDANKANMAAAISSVMKHGYTLQLQIHKITGLD